MERKKFAFIVLLMVTATYFGYYLHRFDCYSRLPTTFEDPELGTYYVYPKPFTVTYEGSRLIWLSIPLIVAWGIFFFSLRKKAALLGIILLVALTSLHGSAVSVDLIQTASALGGYSIVVDVLCAGDEEFMEDPDNVEIAEYSIDQANSLTNIVSPDSFEATFGIHFAVRGWETWDSNDYQHVAAYMALEVWEETGFETGMLYNGYTIEMLCAFTGQDIDGYFAVTFPLANITMIETSFTFCPAIRHEFSYQFWNEEGPKCENDCVMNVWAILREFPQYGWCSECEDWINAHKYKWVIIHPPKPINSSSSGGFGGGGRLVRIP